jgi:hypothetical protein
MNALQAPTSIDVFPQLFLPKSIAMSFTGKVRLVPVKAFTGFNPIFAIICSWVTAHLKLKVLLSAQPYIAKYCASLMSKSPLNDLQPSM